MSRTLAPPPTDRRMWRKALAAVHPDRGGDHETFVWLTALKEDVLGGALALGEAGALCPSCGEKKSSRREKSRSGRSTNVERVPFDEALGHIDSAIDLLHRALSVGARAGDPFEDVLKLLVDYEPVEHGRRALAQCRGASYKQLALCAHRAGMTKSERMRFYELARAIPMSEAMAGHIIRQLSRKDAA